MIGTGLGGFYEAGGMVCVHQMWPAMYATENPEGDQEHLNTVAGHGSKLTALVARHTKALEGSLPPGRVLYHKVAKEVEGQGFK